jgi:excisionase family DNA binding protein
MARRTTAPAPAPVRIFTEDQLCAVLREVVPSIIRDVRAAIEREPCEQKNLLTSQEAARYCSVSKATLLRHVAQGRLVPDSPARHGFRRHRFRRETLDAFLLAAL